MSDHPDPNASGPLSGWAATPDPPSVPDPAPPKPGAPNRKGLVVAVGIAVVVLAALLLLRTGGGDSDVERRLTAAFEDAGMSHRDAACTAQHVVDQMGTGELGKIHDFDATKPPKGLGPDFIGRFGAAQQAAVAACKVDVAGAVGG